MANSKNNNETSDADETARYSDELDDIDDDIEENTSVTYATISYDDMTTKELWDDRDDALYYYIKTTIKVTSKDDNYSFYYDVTDDSGIYVEFNEPQKNIKIGDYITFTGYAEMGYDYLEVTNAKLKKTDKSLFVNIAKKKKVTKPQPETVYNNSSTNNFNANGTGDFVAKGLKVENYAVLTINYTDATNSNFTVTSYEGDDYDDLLVNTIGNYSGKVLIDHSGTFDLEIKSNGSWSISASGLSVENVSSFSGTGDAVTGITTHTGGSWEITNNGNSNFSVVEYGVSEGYLDLLVNEIGSYNGVVKASAEDDNIFFKVTSEGSWSIKKI